MCCRRMSQPLAILSFCVVVFSMADHAQSAELSESDIKEIQQVETALAEGTLPQPPGWAFNHGASEEGERELERLGYPSPSENLEAVVRKAGGWQEYKANAAALLKSKDPVVRGFMAIWVADLGDQTYVPDLLELLKNKQMTPNRITPEGWDRGLAACGLGVLDAKDHVSDLLKCLHHDSPYIRGGAARGLSWMTATEHAPEIAALLADRDDEVACSAIEALARLNATKYVDQITAIATSQDFIHQRSRIAMQALVEMEAKDQVPELAKLVEDSDSPLIRGPAILCIALLDGQDFAEKIAKYMDVEDVREEALMALGIMRHLQSADKVAGFLESTNNRSTRQAAVWSLVMMESKEHASAALKAYSKFDMDQSGILHRTGEATDRRLKRRFEESLKKLQESIP